MRVVTIILGAAILLWGSASALASIDGRNVAFVLAKPAALPNLRGGGAKELPPLLNAAGNVWSAAKHRLQSVVGIFGLRMSPRDKDYEIKVGSCEELFSISTRTSVPCLACSL